MKTFSVDVEKPFQNLLDEADAIVVGAGAGLSTAAGFTYSGARFERYFSDFRERFGIRDMYSGGFFPFPDAETFWGWWCRNIWVNRYAPMPSDLYARLLQALAGRDFFVLTTNVDHAFQRAGLQKERLFYTQGDYGLFQSSEPAGRTATKTYDNRKRSRPCCARRDGISRRTAISLCRRDNMSRCASIPRSSPSALTTARR